MEQVVFTLVCEFYLKIIKCNYYKYFQYFWPIENMYESFKYTKREESKTVLLKSPIVT